LRFWSSRLIGEFREVDGILSHDGCLLASKDRLLAPDESQLEPDGNQLTPDGSLLAPDGSLLIQLHYFFNFHFRQNEISRMRQPGVLEKCHAELHHNIRQPVKE
jgi:hypothetical protein